LSIGPASPRGLQSAWQFRNFAHPHHTLKSTYAKNPASRIHTAREKARQAKRLDKIKRRAAKRAIQGGAPAAGD